MFLLIPLFAGFMYFLWKRRSNALLQLCNVEKLKVLFPSSSKGKVLFRYFVLILAFAFFTVSFVSPRWGYDWKEIETKGSNIYIAIDVSRSMLSNDISPSRLSRAKLELTKLLDKLTGDQVGLIIYAGESFLQSPLTHDYGMVKQWIKELNVGAVPVQGTSIRSAIAIALQGFSYFKSESKALIIISDGEEHDQKTLDIAKKAAQAGIKIYTIGVGTQKGGPIPLKNGLLRDNKGEVVISRLNDTLLKEIAEATGATYTRSSTGDFHLDSLYYEHIKKQLPEEVLRSGKTKLWKESYQIFAAIVLLLLLLEFLLSLDWKRGASLLSMLIPIVLPFKIFNMANLPWKFLAYFSSIIVLFVLNTSAAKANVFNLDLIKGDYYSKEGDFDSAKDHYLSVQVREPHNSRLNYNLGICNYKQGDFGLALRNFADSAKEAQAPLLQEKSFYNLGNALFQLEMYKEAIEAYENALKIIPEDEDAKFNLELARKMLEEQQKNQCDKPNDQDKDQDKDKQDQNQDKDQNDDQKDKGDKEKDKDKNEDNKDDQQDKGDQDQDKDQDQNKGDQDSNSQPKPQGQDQKEEMSKQDLENLLKQVKEADSNPLNRQRFSKDQKNVAPASDLNPW